jgi:mannose-6-phosphate isomerase class I
LTVTKGTSYRSEKERSVEILICIEGGGIVRDTDEGIEINIKQGQSFMVPAHVAQYKIAGSGVFYRASVP